LVGAGVVVAAGVVAAVPEADAPLAVVLLPDEEAAVVLEGAVDVAPVLEDPVVVDAAAGAAALAA